MLRPLPDVASRSVVPIIQRVFATAKLDPKFYHKHRAVKFAVTLRYAFVERFHYLMSWDIDEFLASLRKIDGEGVAYEFEYEQRLYGATDRLTKWHQVACDRVDQFKRICEKKPFTVTVTRSGEEPSATRTHAALAEVLRELAALGQAPTGFDIVDHKIKLPYTSPGSAGEFVLNPYTIFGRVYSYDKFTHVEILSPDVIVDGAAILTLSEDRKTLSMAKVLPPQTPENLKEAFFEKYAGQYIQREIRRRFATNQKLTPTLNRDGTGTDTFVLNPGRYAATHEKARLAVWQGRATAYFKEFNRMADEAKRFVALLAQEPELDLEQAHRRFHQAHLDWKHQHQKFWLSARANCHKNSIPKVPPLVPPQHYWPKLKEVYKRHKVQHEASRKKLLHAFSKMLVEMALYKLKHGKDPACEFTLASPVYPGIETRLKPRYADYAD